MKRSKKQTVLGVLSALMLIAVSATEAVAQLSAPEQIWTKGTVYIGNGGTFSNGILTCKLYNSNGKLLNKSDDGEEGTATFDLTNAANGVVTATFHLSGERDFTVQLLAKDEVVAGEPMLQTGNTKQYILFGGEHPVSDGSTLLHRCKVEVKKDGTMMCHYCIFVKVKNMEPLS